MSNVSVPSALSVRAADRRRHAALVAATLVALARLPRDRRFQERAIMIVIALAAAAALARESNARSVARLARLIAWDQQRNP